MEYKVGDEVLVKVKINYIDRRSSSMPYEVKEKNNKKISPATIWIRKEDIQPEPVMTAEEAWDISMKLFLDYSNSELDEIFGKGWSYIKLMKMTPQQAKDKIKEWEAKKEINVGDEVEFDGEIGVVTKTDGAEGFYNVLFKNGKTGAYNPKRPKKTGRHIDIDGLLEQIRGNE